MAYAALCLAAGGEDINVVSSQAVAVNGAFGFIGNGPEYNADSVSISMLASGADLQGFPPGSSPEGTIYWFNNVLVFLATHLYLPGAADNGISRVVDYCRKNHLAEYVDAVLISVEHVVLVHVTPAKKVQHTAVMPLYKIKNHLSMGVSDRYTDSRLGKLATRGETFKVQGTKRKRKANQADLAEEEVLALYATQVDGEVNSTFYALAHLFEAAACKRMPVAGSTGGRFPDEIYTNIIEQVTDIETRYSLMKISRQFRRICQEDLLFAEGLIFEPSDSCRSCDDAGLIPEWFKKYDVKTGMESRADWKKARQLFHREDGLWWVAIGAERNKKSLLAGVEFRVVNV